MNNKMKCAREAARLSQKQVALTLHVSAPTVSNWESGKINPSVENLKALCQLYNVTADYLLGLDAPPAPDSVLPRNTQQEESLLQDFRELNAEGQEKMLDYADDLVQSGKYKERRAVFMGAETVPA